MLQFVLLCFLLGSAHSFSLSKIVNDTEESSGDTIEESELSVYDLLKKANKDLGESPTDPVVRELDIVVGYGLENAHPCTATGCMWPKAADGKVYVPYTIASQYTQQQRAIIENGLRSFEQGTPPATCIKFIPRTNEAAYADIKIISGCFSHVGRVGTNQTVSLDTNGCLYLHTIQHEMMHVLGFVHEQSRSDRDQHIKVFLQNVDPNYTINFDIINNTNNLNTPYDYNSVMQYPRNAFGITRNSITMEPIPNPNVSFGQARQMSNNDLLRINRLYQC